jgi:hypothetical protein
MVLNGRWEIQGLGTVDRRRDLLADAPRRGDRSAMRAPLTGWRLQLDLNPFGTMAAGAAVVLGILGLILGDGVSQGMTTTLHSTANLTAHLWGAAFAAGGILKLVGLYARRSTIEIPGLWAMTGGYAFYAITVIAGLGMHGLAAGIISGAMTIGCLIKTRIIMLRARQVTRQVAAGEGGQG